MKQLIGLIGIAFLLLISLYGILWLYDIPVFKPELLNKMLITIAIVIVLSILLVILIPFFFARNFKGYDTSKGNIAHPKK